MNRRKQVETEPAMHPRDDSPPGGTVWQSQAVVNCLTPEVSRQSLRNPTASLRETVPPDRDC